jgi:hypothetical protein
MKSMLSYFLYFVVAVTAFNLNSYQCVSEDDLGNYYFDNYNEECVCTQYDAFTFTFVCTGPSTLYYPPYTSFYPPRSYFPGRYYYSDTDRNTQELVETYLLGTNNKQQPPPRDNDHNGGDNHHNGGDNHHNGGDNHHNGGDNHHNGGDNHHNGGDNHHNGGDNHHNGGDNHHNGGDNHHNGGDNDHNGGGEHK